MPESQEVRIIAEVCNNHFAGKTVIGYIFDEKSKFHKYPINNLRLLDRIGGWTLEKVESHGKKVIFKLISTDGTLYILSSLGMEGRWVLSPENHSNFCLCFGNGETRQIEYVLWYDDSRHFGTIEIHSETSMKKRMEKIGPDLYKDNVSLSDFTSKIRGPRIKSKSVFTFLMDQKYFSGLGAYLTAESLYQAKLSPHRELRSLSDKEIEALLTSIKETLDIASKSHGLTIRSFHSPDGHQGTFPCKVYGKSIDPNGHAVIRSEFNKRNCWWVREVQI